MSNLIHAALTETLTIPTYEILVLLLLLTFALVFKTVRLGLLVAYLFALRLNWFFFKDFWGENGLLYLYVFTIVGVIILLLSIWRMWDMDVK